MDKLAIDTRSMAQSVHYECCCLFLLVEDRACGKLIFRILFCIVYLMKKFMR
uniref:Uncharacterized protein n=1 Tax=Arundo donax TaxID=35708 RepID=A0A0A9G2P0_ARUDO